MIEQKEKVKHWFTKVGRSVADKLNGWINPLSQAAKKKGLIVAGLLTSTICLILVMQSINSHETSPVLEVDQMTMPADLHPQDKKAEEDTERDIIERYNRMIRFKNILEKLNAMDDKVALDSLMKTYPGLRDSLNEFLKQYY